MTHETSPLDPAGGIQTKAHAPGVGIVEVGAIDDPEGETLVLIERNQLDAAGLDAAREAALTLDVRAYRTASAVYGGTPPLGQPRQPPPPARAAGCPTPARPGRTPGGGCAAGRDAARLHHQAQEGALQAPQVQAQARPGARPRGQRAAQEEAPEEVPAQAPPTLTPTSAGRP